MTNETLWSRGKLATFFLTFYLDQNRWTTLRVYVVRFVAKKDSRWYKKWVLTTLITLSKLSNDNHLNLPNAHWNFNGNNKETFNLMPLIFFVSFSSDHSGWKSPKMSWIKFKCWLCKCVDPKTICKYFFLLFYLKVNIIKCNGWSMIIFGPN